MKMDQSYPVGNFLVCIELSEQKRHLSVVTLEGVIIGNLLFVRQSSIVHQSGLLVLDRWEELQHLIKTSELQGLNNRRGHIYNCFL